MTEIERKKVERDKADGALSWHRAQAARGRRMAAWYREDPARERLPRGPGGETPSDLWTADDAQAYAARHGAIADDLAEQVGRLDAELAGLWRLEREAVGG